MRELTKEEADKAAVYVRAKVQDIEQQFVTYAALNAPDNIPATVVSLVHACVIIMVSEMLYEMFKDGVGLEDKEAVEKAIGGYIAALSGDIYSKTWEHFA